MNRILGIDYGEKRIGLAISDPLMIIASEYDILSNDDLVMENIEEIIKKEKIEKIVMGLPYNMDNSLGFQSDIVKEFGEKLKVFKLPIIYIDERLSSKKAQETFDVLKVKNKRLDAKAAAIILQDFLDFH